MTGSAGQSDNGTEGSTVEVELSRSADWVTISVRDHGPGILDEEHDKIFGLFSQTHSGTELGTHGVGLGLPISNRIAQLHGGELRYENPKYEGARFVLALPIRAEAKLPAQQSPSQGNRT